MTYVSVNLIRLPLGRACGIGCSRRRDGDAEGAGDAEGLAMVVKEVMSTEVLTVPLTATIAETATVMGKRGVGSALVMDGDQLVGIFTERDALRAVASDFGAAHHLVTQFMTPRPSTVSADMPTHEALDMLMKRGFRHLPVVEA